MNESSFILSPSAQPQWNLHKSHSNLNLNSEGLNNQQVMRSKIGHLFTSFTMSFINRHGCSHSFQTIIFRGQSSSYAVNFTKRHECFSSYCITHHSWERERLNSSLFNLFMWAISSFAAINANSVLITLLIFILWNDHTFKNQFRNNLISITMIIYQ